MSGFYSGTSKLFEFEEISDLFKKAIIILKECTANCIRGCGKCPVYPTPKYGDQWVHMCFSLMFQDGRVRL